MTNKDYYTAPSDEIFEDIKANATKIWQTYNNEHGYVDEKLNRIKNIQNIDDNAWYIVAMFDLVNIKKLMLIIKPETRVKLREVLIFGGYRDFI